MDALLTTVKIVVDLLVRGEYGALESMTRGRRLKGVELARAIEDYGRRLRPIPASAWDELDVVPLEGDSSSFHIVVDLWTEEEGRSDLSLEMLLRDLYGGAYDVEILNLHAL